MAYMSYLRAWSQGFSSLILIVASLFLTVALAGCDDQYDDFDPPANDWDIPSDFLQPGGDQLQDHLILNVNADDDFRISARAGVLSSNYGFYAVTNSQNVLQGLAVVNSGRRKFYSLQQVEQGVALLTKHRGPISKDVIRIAVNHFSPERGGRIVLTLLREYGLFSDDYRTFEVVVGLDSNNQWAIARQINGALASIDELYFETRLVDGSAVGIEAVHVKKSGRELENVSTEDLP